MSFSDKINSLSKSCHFHIRDIRRIRHLLPLSAATVLCKFICLQQTWLLQFSLLWHLTSKLNKLQRIQNSLARVITKTSKYQHITPTLKNYTGFQSNKELNTNSVFAHTKHLQINSLHIFTIVFYFHSICQIITWQKGVLCHWSTTLEFTPSWYPKFEFCTSFRSRLKTHLFKIAFPP